MQRGCHRSIGWILIAALLVGPLAPILRAQDYNFAPGSPQYDEAVGRMRDRLASREGLEDLYKRAAGRQVQIQADLQALQTMAAPAGVSQREWQSQYQTHLQRLQQEAAQNQAVMNRYRGKLGPIYTQLQGDLEKIKGSNNDELKQQIGTLIGAGGGAVVPIWNRMTAADYAAMARYGANNAQVAVINRVQPALQNVATNAGTRAANAEAALGNLGSIQWTPEPSASGTNMVLSPRDAATGEVIAGRNPIETNIPAKITNAQGQVVDNPNAVGAGNDLAQLYNTRSQLGNEISAARLKASRAINNAEKTFFENRANSLEQRRVELESSIQGYESSNPSVGTRAKALAVDAGKWAAMSVGITLGANVISQLAKNNWDVSKVSWGQATSFLVDGHFWGGTAGSFLGSMAGAAIASALPGGVFVKTLLSIGGAAAGWQIGSGQGGKTDWAALGVTTLGSTAGFLVGMAIGGPIGAFLGGIIGQLASQYIYDKLKEMLIREESSSSYQAQVPAGPPPGNQTGPYPGGLPPPAQYPGGVPVPGPGQYPNVGQVPGPGQYPGGTTVVGVGQAPVLPPVPGTGQYSGGYTPPSAPPNLGGADPSEVAGVTEQMKKAYNDYLAYQQAGEQSLAALRLKEYQQFRSRLQQMRRGAAQAGPTDFRESR